MNNPSHSQPTRKVQKDLTSFSSRKCICENAAKSEQVYVNRIAPRTLIVRHAYNDHAPRSPVTCDKILTINAPRCTYFGTSFYTNCWFLRGHHRWFLPLTCVVMHGARIPDSLMADSALMETSQMDIPWSPLQQASWPLSLETDLSDVPNFCQPHDTEIHFGDHALLNLDPHEAPRQITRMSSWPSTDYSWVYSEEPTNCTW